MIVQFVTERPTYYCL